MTTDWPGRRVGPMAREKLPPGEKRDRRISVPCNDDEFGRLKAGAAADNAGAAADWLRRLGLARADELATKAPKPRGKRAKN